MRIRTDGKHARRKDTIEQAADFWDCNKTKALMQSAEFAWRVDSGIRNVLARDDLTLRQKQEIAEALSVPSYYEIDVSQRVEVEK